MPNNELQRAGNNPVAKIKNYLADVSVKERFEEMLGKRAGAFTNSLINVVRNSNKLQKCTPESVISSAIVAATVNLPIDPALGQAAIVPYGKTAQFQIMYKGVTQLCIRSGQYEQIHCTEVYKDELEFWNPITGEIKFTDQSSWKMRSTAKQADVVGHFCRFKLVTGFGKCDYMTFDEALAHAKKYSKAYQYDLKDNKRLSKWSLDPVPMGNKTILLRLLTKYGVMSIEMQQAIIADHEDFEDAQARAARQIEGETGSEVINLNPDEVTEVPEQENEVPAFMINAADEK